MLFGNETCSKNLSICGRIGLGRGMNEEGLMIFSKVTYRGFRRLTIAETVFGGNKNVEEVRTYFLVRKHV